MRRRLLASFFLFALGLVVALEVPLGLSLARNDRATAMSDVQRDASSLAVLVAGSLNGDAGSGLQLVISQFARADSAVVAVISSGHVLASAGRGAVEELREGRTKAITRSAASGHVSGEEGSNDSDDDFLYVALPVAITAQGSSGVVSSAHRSDVVLLVAESATALHVRIRNHWIALSLFGVGVLAVAAALGTILARSLTRPLEHIESAVAAVGAGRLSERAPIGRGPAELNALRRHRQRDGGPPGRAGPHAKGVPCRRLPSAPDSAHGVALAPRESRGLARSRTASRSHARAR